MQKCFRNNRIIIYLKCVGVGLAVTLQVTRTVSRLPTYIPRIFRIEQKGATEIEK